MCIRDRAWALRGALGALLGHLGRSNASRPTPVQVQGMGVGGEVSPSPNGGEWGLEEETPKTTYGWKAGGSSSLIFRSRFGSDTNV
eukprot:3547386-Pyramimonas_sp.AAC.1